MKKVLIIIISVFILHSTCLKAQVTDTAVYIQQILLNKSNYIGKPFSVLEKDLKVKLKCFILDAGIHWDQTKETSTSMWFIKPTKMEDFSFPRLRIYWQPYLDYKKSDSLWDRNDGGNWTPEADSFYSLGIIKDIGFSGDTTRNTVTTTTPPATTTTTPTLQKTLTPQGTQPVTPSGVQKTVNKTY